jgi:hypothetical protein
LLPPFIKSFGSALQVNSPLALHALIQILSGVAANQDARMQSEVALIGKAV